MEIKTKHDRKSIIFSGCISNGFTGFIYRLSENNYNTTYCHPEFISGSEIININRSVRFRNDNSRTTC